MTPAYAWLLFDMQHLVRVVTDSNITVKDPGANIVPTFFALPSSTYRSGNSQLIPKASYLTTCSMERRMGVGRTADR